MSDQGNKAMESVSALMDSEADELEFHRVLKEVGRDDELRRKWQRYHLVSASLKSELPSRFVDLSDAIRAAVDNEPSHAKTFSFHSAVKPLGRFAIAASVAVIAVLGVQQYQQQEAPNADLAPLAAMDMTAEPQDEPFVPRAFNTPQIPLRTVNASNGISSQSEPRPVVVLRRVDPGSALDQQLIQDRLNELLLQHADNAALNTYQGMMPFARIPQAAEE